MPSVEKTRRNADGGCWTRIQWYSGSVRQTPVTVRADTLAQLEREVEAELGRLTHEIHLRKSLQAEAESAGEVMTCNDLVREWLVLHVDVELTGATPREYAKDAADWFCPFWGDRPLSTLSRADGLGWRKWLLEEIAAGGNSRLGDYEHAGWPRVNRLLTMGQSVFSFAVKNGWIDEKHHPLKGVSQLKYVPPTETDDFLFEPELAEAIRLVIAEIKPQHRASPVLKAECRLAISCLAYLGLTQQDLFDARFKQALHDDGTPRDYFEIPRRLSGSGRKSHNRKREVEMPCQVQEEIVALWQLRGCPPVDGLILPNQVGKSYTRQNWQRDFWRPAIEAVKQLRVETVTIGLDVVDVAGRRDATPKRLQETPRFHDIPVGQGIGPHAARRCAVRMWALAGWLDVDVLDAIGHDVANDKTLYRFYKKAAKGVRKREHFVALEDQIDAARAKYSSEVATAERDRVLAEARERAEFKLARQRAGRAASRLKVVAQRDERVA